MGYLDASNRGHQRSMPGGYAGYLADGTFATFESYDAIYIDVLDSQGRPLFIQQSESTITKMKERLARCGPSSKCFDEFFYDEDEERNDSTFVDYITLSMKVSIAMMSSLSQNQTYLWRFD